MYRSSLLHNHFILTWNKNLRYTTDVLFGGRPLLWSGSQIYFRSGFVTCITIKSACWVLKCASKRFHFLLVHWHLFKWLIMIFFVKKVWSQGSFVLCVLPHTCLVVRILNSTKTCILHGACINGFDMFRFQKAIDLEATDKWVRVGPSTSSSMALKSISATL